MHPIQKGLIEAIIALHSCVSNVKSNVIRHFQGLSILQSKYVREKTGMNVIFLDVDGVLNSEECDHAPREGDKGSEEFFYHEIIPVPLLRRSLDNLRCVLQQTEAKIVISSSWRLFPERLELLTRILESLSSSEEPVVIGLTPDLSDSWAGRGEEVRLWLERNKNCSRFVLVDDEHLASFEKSIFSEEEYSRRGLLMPDIQTQRRQLL